jgi:hypothetical protein
VVLVWSWYSTSASARAVFSHRRPHHRAQAAIQRAVHQEAADFRRDRGFRGDIHGGVAVGIIAFDAQAAELGGLDAHPFGGVGAALGAEFQHRDGVLVLVAAAVLFLDLPLDRQAVAVPAGDVVGVVAGHLAAAIDEVLQDLVQPGADMQVAVGVGRAVVEDEFGASGAGGAQLRPQAHGVPACQDSRLVLRQVAAHGEGRARQEDRVAIVGFRRVGGVVHGW